MFCSTLRIYVFLLVSHLSTRLMRGGRGSHRADTLFLSLPLLPSWLFLPTSRFGRIREFQTLCHSLWVAEAIVGVPSTRRRGYRAVSLWQTTQNSGECFAPSLQAGVREAVKQKRTKSVSRACSPGRRRGCAATATLSGPGRCAASGGGPAVRPEDGLGSSPATVPPSKKLFFHLERLRVAMKTDFPRGPTLPLRSIGLEKPKWPESRDKKGPLSGSLERES